MKILVTSSPFQGHVTPLLSAATELVARGHNVRFMTGSRFRERIESRGIEFVPLPTLVDFDDRNIEATFPHRAELRGIRQLRFDVGEVFLAAAPTQRAQIDAELAREPADAILTDPLFLGSLVMVGVPREQRPLLVALGIAPLPLAGGGKVPPFGLGLLPRAGIFGRIRDGLAGAATNALLYRPLDGDFQRVLGPYLGPQVGARAFNELASQLDLLLLLTVPGFEYPRPAVDPTVRFVGPLTSASSTAELPEWWGELDTARPVVHVTQGTLANRDWSQLVMPTVTALANDDVLVVVTTGGAPLSTLPAKLPANVRVAEYLPYDELLPKVDVLVTNGGYGGVQQALGCGVPVAAFGASEDKPEVIARIRYSGAGLGKATGRPRPRAIRTAVRRLLAEPSFRQRASDLSAQITDSRGVAAIADHIERQLASN
jgi:UDP:flavonoid glycosyltransferase YjiC (YdhE family)